MGAPSPNSQQVRLSRHHLPQKEINDNNNHKQCIPQPSSYSDHEQVEKQQQQQTNVLAGKRGGKRFVLSPMVSTIQPACFSLRTLVRSTMQTFLVYPRDYLGCCYGPVTFCFLSLCVSRQAYRSPWMMNVWYGVQETEMIESKQEQMMPDDARYSSCSNPV